MLCVADMSSYRSDLLPILKSKTTHIQRCRIAALKKTRKSYGRPLQYIPAQPYVEKDATLEEHGYKVVRNVFKDTRHLDLMHMIADSYNLNMCEFADKHGFIDTLIVPLLKDEDFIDEYRKVYGGPFLWQKATIHRKKKLIQSTNDASQFDKECVTGEHVDITETPNSALTITAYIAISDQYLDATSKLMVYPKSHLHDILIPVENFDYVSSAALDAKALNASALDAKALDAKALDAKALNAKALDAKALNAKALDAKALHAHQSVFCEINSIVESAPELDWVRECLYHLIVMNLPEYEILNSTFMLMLFNKELFEIEPVPIRLRKGDVLFFLSNVLHGSTPHRSETSSRVSLAVRGGYPYYEESALISHHVPNEFYRPTMRRNHFLFSGTSDMIKDIPNGHEFPDIIYEL